LWNGKRGWHEEWAMGTIGDGLNGQNGRDRRR